MSHDMRGLEREVIAPHKEPDRENTDQRAIKDHLEATELTRRELDEGRHQREEKRRRNGPKRLLKHFWGLWEGEKTRAATRYPCYGSSEMGEVPFFRFSESDLSRIFNDVADAVREWQNIHYSAVSCERDAIL